MGHKCGNCNVEFQNRDQLARHVLFVHESEFDEEADPKLWASQQTLKAKPEWEAVRRIMGGK